MNIFLDFDGTVVHFEYPRIGTPLPLAIETIKQWQQAGHKIWLNTRRADMNNGSLYEAIEYLTKKGIILDHVLSIKQLGEFLVDGTVVIFNDSGEDFIFVDDEASGTPLTKDKDVDWSVLQSLLNPILCKEQK